MEAHIISYLLLLVNLWIPGLNVSFTNMQKQLKQSGTRVPLQKKTAPFEGKLPVSTDQTIGSLDASELVSDVQDQPEQPCTERKRPPVHDRIRVPVAYDDLVGLDDSKDGSP